MSLPRLASALSLSQSTMNTNAHISPNVLCTALCAALIATCTQASARPPQPRAESGTIEKIGHDARTCRDQSCCGTIETIDYNARLLRIQRDGDAGPLTLVWNGRTSFVDGTRSVTAAELTRGTRVTVWYRTPFFGKRFATKIVIERGAVRPKQQRPNRSPTTVPRTDLR